VSRTSVPREKTYNSRRPRIRRECENSDTASHVSTESRTNALRKLTQTNSLHRLILSTKSLITHCAIFTNSEKLSCSYNSWPYEQSYSHINYHLCYVR